MRPCSDISAPFSSRCPSAVTLWLSVAVDPATTNDNPCHSLSSDCKRRRPACAWPTPHTHTRTRTHTVPPYSAVRMDTVCVRTPGRFTRLCAHSAALATSRLEQLCPRGALGQCHLLVTSSTRVHGSWFNRSLCGPLTSCTWCSFQGTWRSGVDVAESCGCQPNDTPATLSTLCEPISDLGR